VDAALGTAGQVPEQKGVNVTEYGIARLGQFPYALHVFENPADFQAAEIRCERQPGLAAETILPACFCQLADVVRDPRVCHTRAFASGLPVFAVPHNGGLALVGDADSGQILR